MQIISFSCQVMPSSAWQPSRDKHCFFMRNLHTNEHKHTQYAKYKQPAMPSLVEDAGHCRVGPQAAILS